MDATRIPPTTSARSSAVARATAIVITTLRGVRGRARRLSTTAFAVLLGVAFTAGTLVLTDTLRDSFDAMHVDAHATVDLAVRKPASFGTGADAVRDRVPAGLAATVATVPGVDAAAGRTTGWAQLTARDGSLLGDVASGVDPIGENWITADRLNPWEIDEGVPPSGPSQAVVDRAAARTLGVSPGDAVEVTALGGTRTMTVSGIATFGGADARFGTVTVLFDDPTAQAMLGTPDHHDDVLVALAPAADADTTRAQLGTALGDGLEVVAGTDLVAEARAAHAEDWGFFDTFMRAFAVIALVVGGFIIFNTFSITVAQRTREFASLRAIGAGRSQVLGSVLTESAAVGVVASAIGTAAGVGVSSALRSLFVAVGLELPDGGVVVRPTSLVAAMTVGVVMTGVSALLPAWRASRTPPVAAMRDASTDASGNSHRRLAVGTVVVGGGVAAMTVGLTGVADDPVAPVGLGGLAVFAGVAVLGPVAARPFGRLLGRPVTALRGVPGGLARDNAIRNPGRTAATSAALMIGVGLVGFITVVAASVKASIDEMVGTGVRADVVVESGSFGFGGFDRTLVDELRRLPEVAGVSGSALATAEVDGEPTEVIGVTSSEIGGLLELGSTDGSLLGPDGRGLGRHHIAVNTAVADARGWVVGSSVPVVLADGVVRAMSVAAVFEDPFIGLPLLVDVELLESVGHRPFDIQVFVAAADGVDRTAVLETVTATAAAFPNATVLDREAFAENRSALVDPLLGVVYALLGFAVLIATLGIANTLALSVMERRREIGVLRAIGATRTQIRTAIRWESVMIAGYGTVLGLAIGTAFGWAVVRALEGEGIRHLAIPVGQLGVVATLAVATGVLAAVLPARRAARTDALTAMRP